MSFEVRYAMLEDTFWVQFVECFEKFKDVFLLLVRELGDSASLLKMVSIMKNLRMDK